MRTLKRVKATYYTYLESHKGTLEKKKSKKKEMEFMPRLALILFFAFEFFFVRLDERDFFFTTSFLIGV